MNSKKSEMIKECTREEENCLYTSTTFYSYLSFLRRCKTFFIAVPLLLGGFSGVEILTTTEVDYIKYFIGISALLAGVIPSIYSSLKIDYKIEILDSIAGKYKIFQSRFRRLRNINSKGNSFEDDFDKVLKELEELKSNSITAPERFFKKAQKKISKGDYNFSSDNTKNV